MTISFSRGDVYDADLTSRGWAFAAVSHAAVLEGVLSLEDEVESLGRLPLLVGDDDATGREEARLLRSLAGRIV